MPFAIGVKFRRDSFSRYYHPGDLVLEIDDFCWVKDDGIGIERTGFVSCIEGRAPIQMRHLPKVIRLSTQTEVEAWYQAQGREREMLNTVREQAGVHKLSLKVSEVVFNEEKRQVFVHFTSDSRVDFRDLVKDLAGRFKSRIEMWQVGARKEAGLRDGMGICGNKLCCSNWMKDFPSISMRFAKDQDIVQPPSKLSGPCGRLRCCLRYEHEAYIALSVGAPALGCAGCSSDGSCGVVIDRNLIKQEATMRKAEGGTTIVPFSEFEPDEKQPEKRKTNGSRRSSGRRSKSDPPREE